MTVTQSLENGMAGHREALSEEYAVHSAQTRSSQGKYLQGSEMGTEY